MDIIIKVLDKKYFKTAIEYFKVGMHFDVYFKKGDKMLDKYSKFFWYSELLEAIDVLAAYDEIDKLVGLLLAEFYNKPKIYKSLSEKIYCKNFERKKYVDSDANQYVINNEMMLKKLKGSTRVDGEIRFLACDPCLLGKGIGSKLLNEFEKIRIKM